MDLKDLEYFGIRKDFYFSIKGKRTYLLVVFWLLLKFEKKVFCKRFFDFKGFDGYCLNILRGVLLEDCKVLGFKLYDYYVLM